MKTLSAAHPRPVFACLFAVLLALGLSAVGFAQGAAGAITGTISNSATGRMLEGATVTIPELHRSELTDDTGRFRFTGVPGGEYTVVASYTGLEEARTPAHVAPPETAAVNFDLTAAIYKLDAFTVTGEREGNAASITRQRTADTVKHVVSMDAFGNLANDNAGELLLRLPGIAGVHDLDGNISEVNIRGTASNLNLVTVDGNLMASNFGTSRSFALRSISGSLFSEIEVTKAPTPDMPADSIGGAINFKSASPLDMKGGRRITYGASFRWAPRWVKNVPMAYEHPLHPTLKAGWQQVFDVGGGQRNLGLTFNTFYSENSSGGFTGTNAYENTLSRHAYLYDYQARDIYNNRKQTSVSLKIDYRLSPSTTITASALLNEDDQPFNYWFIDRAVTSQSVATLNAAGQPTGTGTILPNYTDNLTQVRGLNNSQMILTSQLIGFDDLQTNFNLGAKHKFGRLQVNYDGAYSLSHALFDTGEHGNRPGGAAFTESVRSVGWTIDRGVSEEYPRWTQTEGPNISDPSVYTPSSLQRRNNSQGLEIISAKGDATYQLATAVPVNLKTGFSFRRQEIRHWSADRQWTPIGAAPGSLASLVDLNKVHTSEEDRIGRQIPFIDPGDLVKDIRNNPGHWSEDLYYNVQHMFQGRDTVREDVAAGFGQGQVVLGRLKVLAGLRYERTDVSSKGYVPSIVQSTTAQRAANPVGTATADNNYYLRSSGAYDNWFPGVYLTYNITKNLLLRADWSNSIGRPAFSTLVPTFSVNNTTEVVNVNNAGLGPQTSENWDAGVEYYFEPVGVFSANVFRKNLHDFIVTGTTGTIGTGKDNGFNGDYAGYDLTSTFNGGQAKIDGFEIGYQQRFEFLPKALSGLSAFATYTWLRTDGDYGSTSTAPRSTSDVLNFIPEAINAGLSYSYHGWGARASWNRTGKYLNSYNANPALLRYTLQRDMYDASISYRTRRGHTFFVDVRNITNSPRSWGRPAGVTNAYIFFTSVNFGVKGEF
jgi:TonB-dependent receptor